ncbi:MAG: hypothetical protein B6I26_06200 [Desulfobacteraceae bacterium 4572_130]|nr:MAG: hypothetical protein B6I26_06200 [Desulfobacteraceae bacterium 4572_130]
MKIEILSIGDEILLGGVKDTNFSWLAAKLLDNGITITRQTCIGDNLKNIISFIQKTSKRADIVIVTGGLGPTSDDITSKAVALATKDKLVLNKKALLSIENYFKQKGLDMPETNKKQAEFPLKALIIENSYGTAPGFYLKIRKPYFFFMPGVPFEMKKMFKADVLPIIKKKINQKTQIFLKKFTVFGLAEAEINSRLKDFSKNFPKIKLGFRANFPLIEVKFSYDYNNKYTDAAQSTNNVVKQAGNWIASKLGNKIISFQGLSMEQEVIRLLIKNNLKIAVAESCTGGLISHMLTNVSGSSECFIFSGITYFNDAKINILNVNKNTIIKYGAVHGETAKEMAEGVKNITKADYGISTSGIAGPKGGTDEKPVGTVCIGIAGYSISMKKNFSWGKKYNFPFKERFMNKKIFAVTALELLRREILKRKIC